MSYSLVITYVDELSIAKNIANKLISQKLAACVNILPNVISIYEWKNEVQQGNEILVIVKTKQELFENVRQEIKKNHTYELPAIIEIPIGKGSKEFLDWIEKNTQ